MKDEVYFWHPDKHPSLLQVDTIMCVCVCVCVCMRVCVCVTRHAQSTQNKRFAYLCNYLQKSMGDDVDFLPADKHESFLQDDSITLSVCSQECPKPSKQQVRNIFAISQGKREG